MLEQYKAEVKQLNAEIEERRKRLEILFVLINIEKEKLLGQIQLDLEA